MAVLSQFSLVLEVPPAEPQDASRHFASKLSVETDPSDVMLDLQRRHRPRVELVERAAAHQDDWERRGWPLRTRLPFDAAEKRSLSRREAAHVKPRRPRVIVRGTGPLQARVVEARIRHPARASANGPKFVPDLSSAPKLESVPRAHGVCQITDDRPVSSRAPDRIHGLPHALNSAFGIHECAVLLE